MNKLFRFIIPFATIVSVLFSTLCHSEIAVSPGVINKAVSATEPQYTFLKNCKDITNHDNAAFTKLSCPSINGYQVRISEQGPQFFNIHLSKGELNINTDFTLVSKDMPVEAGKAIEWHFFNNKPKYMIFRLSWGREDAPFNMREHLVVNLITNKNICALATVDVKNNKNANQKARDLIVNKFQKTSSCPDVIAHF
ncbi:hypothetical protein MNBD_GAMMA08-2845 [hydrothermal vent metagenome]|uniref:Uncharacterized protein n=1 Tax=hydrothermal vent metagenome TaxID=652676 RepID=A0A3B0XIB8_9ZZZZ